MEQELKERIARGAASTWSRCFKCDGIVNESGQKCEKPSHTCWKWFDGYKTALIALDVFDRGEVDLNKTQENTGENKGAMDALRELGYKPRWDPAQRCFVFYHKGNKVMFFPKKGWFSGKGLENGYGLDNLISQLKGDLAPVKIIKP